MACRTQFKTQTNAVLRLCGYIQRTLRCKSPCSSIGLVSRVRLGKLHEGRDMTNPLRAGLIHGQNRMCCPVLNTSFGACLPWCAAAAPAACPLPMSRPGGPLSLSGAGLDRGAHASASDSATRLGACCCGASPFSDRDRLRSPRWCSCLSCSRCWCLCFSLCLPFFFAA